MPAVTRRDDGHANPGRPVHRYGQATVRHHLARTEDRDCLRRSLGSGRPSCRLRAHSGLDPGQVVAIALPNGAEYLVSFLATTRARLVAAPMNPTYKAEEFSSCSKTPRLASSSRTPE